MQKLSVYQDCVIEADKHKWIRSQQEGRDLGDAAINEWFREHWWGYLRSRWIEHIEGKRFWMELDRGNFGILQHRFEDKRLLLDRILDRVKEKKENLDVIIWGLDWGINMCEIHEILSALDINSRRLVHKYEC